MTKENNSTLSRPRSWLLQSRDGRIAVDVEYRQYWAIVRAAVIEPA
jgi:hypothetical protein